MEAGPEVSFAEMERLQDTVGDAMRKDPDVEGVVTVVGVSALNPTPNAGHLKIIAEAARQPQGRRQRRSSSACKPASAPIPGMIVYFQPVQDMQISTRTSRAQYQYTLVGTDADEVANWSAKLAEKLRASPVLREVVSEAQDGGLRAIVKVDRETAGRLGVSMQAVNDALNDAFGQRQISTIYAQANQYRVVLEAMPQYQSDPGALSRCYVPGRRRRAGAAERGRQDRAPHRAARHQPPGPVPVGDHQLQSGAGRVAERRGRMPSRRPSSEIGMPTSVTGTTPATPTSSPSSLAGQPWLILAAVVTIYIVLGVLYESFVHPFTILTTLPSAGIGALLALMLCGMDLSLVALIGIVLLMGIVKKNAIMMIDFALEAERDAGHVPARCDRPGLPAALPADHDDDAGRPVRRAAAGAGERHRLGAAGTRSASPSSAACC